MPKFAVFLAVCLSFAAGLSLGIFSSMGPGVPADSISDNVSDTPRIITPSEPFGISINVPAVDNTGKGVTTQIFVGVTQGTGQALVDVNQILFWVDTQFSIRTAKNVAENFTGADLSNRDIKYGIKTRAELIEGPSAGAALAIATIAALQNKTIPPDVMITGTIEIDGTVGPVGGIIEKAEASKDAGARLFLVPLGEAVIKRYVPQTSCQHIGSFRFCNTRFVTEQINVEESVGIDVQEVRNIREAAPFFGL